MFDNFLFSFAITVRTDEVGGVFGERGVHGDEVALGPYVLQVSPLDAHLDDEWGHIGVVLLQWSYIRITLESYCGLIMVSDDNDSENDNKNNENNAGIASLTAVYGRSYLFEGVRGHHGVVSDHMHAHGLGTRCNHLQRDKERKKLM